MQKRKYGTGANGQDGHPEFLAFLVLLAIVGGMAIATYVLTGVSILAAL